MFCGESWNGRWGKEVLGGGGWEGREVELKVKESDIELSMFSRGGDRMLGVRLMVVGGEREVVGEVSSEGEKGEVEGYVEGRKKGREGEGMGEGGVRGVLSG